MEEGPSGGQDQPSAPRAVPTEGGADGAPDPLAAEAAELRQMIDAGASSPEELRALAARLREHRQREEARWRAEVRPQLRKQGKGRLRSQPAPPTLPGASPAPPPGVPIPPPPGGPAPDVAAPAAVEGLGAPWTPPGTPITRTAVPAEPAPGSRALWVGLGLLAMVGLAVLAARTTVWVLLLPVLGLLVWA
ncbi:MAG: hypothetical protein ACO1PW_10315, partial [Actinomycetota bacterium]